MAFANVTGLPLLSAFGTANRMGYPVIATASSTGVSAADSGESYIGHIYWADGGSHTVDTSGSSALEWRSGSVTFSNAGSAIKVGLAAVDLSNGPPARPANTAGVVNFDVSKTMTGGGGGVTANAWQTHVPDTGTKTMAHGDLIAFSVQFTTRAGSDTFQVSYQANASSTIPGLPVLVANTSVGSWGAVSGLPNCVITASDGTLGFFYGACNFTTITTQTWNSSSSPNEYGNVMQFPFPVRIYGVTFGALVSGNLDVVLYSDPLGTPAAEETVSVDLNAVGIGASHSCYTIPFDNTYDLAASTPVAVIFKPSTTTNLSALYKTLNASAHQAGESLGTACYAVNRSSGAFAAQNSSKDRFPIGLVVSAFDDGVSAGGGQTSYGFA